MKRPKLGINWSLGLLGLSLAVLGALALQGYQADRRHRHTALTLLADYSAFAAWSYKERAQSALRATMERSLHQQTRHVRGPFEFSPLVLRQAVADDADCGCAHPATPAEASYLFSIARDSLLSLDPDPADAAIARALRARFRAMPRAGQGLLPLDAQRWLAYAVARRTPEDTILFAVRFHGKDMNEVFQQAFCPDGLLPPSLARGLALDSLLTVAVYTPGSREPVWTSAAGASLNDAALWRHAAEDTLATTLGTLIARAAIRPEAAPSLIIGGLPRSRMPLLFALFAISAGLAVLSARQLRRERALVRTRERFVTSVSHELRTPLSQIRLFLETLHMGRASSAAQRAWALAHIDRETTRLAHLVENVLHVARPPVAAVTTAPVIELDAELHDLVNGFLPLARSRRARISCQLEPGTLATIRREHLRQIVLNLLDNAVKYGPVGQTITLSTRATAEHVQIAIVDQGPGVAAQDREHIWSAFQRGTTDNVLATGGTGIGLTIVRDLARQYGGSVDLAASAAGATFVVELPRVRLGPVAADTRDRTAVHAS
jgi:signal transduction histidine kinase